MNRPAVLLIAAALPLTAALAWPAPARAEPDATLVAKINSIKIEIIEAEAIEKRYAAALKHCAELDGKSFYMQNQDRVLNLEQYQQSLDNLVREQTFNPAKKGPWTTQDAAERLKLVEKMAENDKHRCELAAKLPALQKELSTLEKE